MGKKQARHRPRIHTRRREQEEYRLCNGDGCRNVIATWLKTTICSRCRGRRVRR